MMAMTKCIVCKTRPKAGTSCYSFPTDKSMRKKWLEALELPVDTPLESTVRVCEDHFAPEDRNFTFKKLAPVRRWVTDPKAVSTAATSSTCAKVVKVKEYSVYASLDEQIIEVEGISIFSDDVEYDDVINESGVDLEAKVEEELLEMEVSSNVEAKTVNPLEHLKIKLGCPMENLTKRGKKRKFSRHVQTAWTPSETKGTNTVLLKKRSVGVQADVDSATTIGIGSDDHVAMFDGCRPPTRLRKRDNTLVILWSS